ncbi:cupin domain-containing protein [Macrococcus equipercicus]|uniref:Cupin domain-containing protein n=1 Tax=Macrococcus equipercicus TaxID=69967 RepID=A0A9Q9BWE3_9STAP|nr:cupin domain-containing protein [Macrococcus equipercicus]UTH14273.1 cupin domain-containing protein [Macrococcus equipercicus]
MSYKIIHAPVSPSAPNHIIYPAIVYSQAVTDPAETFKNNGWQRIWENGVFDYHHFHPNAHEVLGVKSGDAELMIGGENGQKLKVQTGDVILLPAGYGHKLLSRSDDFKVVGAYPEDKKIELLTSYDNLTAIQSRINQVMIPPTDPVEGKSGPMFKEWAGIYHCSTV